MKCLRRSFPFSRNLSTVCRHVERPIHVPLTERLREAMSACRPSCDGCACFDFRDVPIVRPQRPFSSSSALLALLLLRSSYTRSALSVRTSDHADSHPLRLDSPTHPSSPFSSQACFVWCHNSRMESVEVGDVPCSRSRASAGARRGLPTALSTSALRRRTTQPCQHVVKQQCDACERIRC